MKNLTKKQLAAIQRVIVRAEKRYNGEKSSGQIVTDEGVIVTDGYVGIFYPERQELKQNSVIQKDQVKNLLSKYKEYLESDGYAINDPFDMRLCNHPQTWLKNNLKESPSIPCYDGAKSIVLSASKSRFGNDELKGRFKHKDIIDACEAVGNNAVCYLVNNLVKNNYNMPVMLVIPWENSSLVTDEVTAIVMPLILE